MVSSNATWGCTIRAMHIEHVSCTASWRIDAALLHLPGDQQRRRHSKGSASWQQQHFGRQFDASSIHATAYVRSLWMQPGRTRGCENQKGNPGMRAGALGVPDASVRKDPRGAITQNDTVGTLIRSATGAPVGKAASNITTSGPHSCEGAFMHGISNVCQSPRCCTCCKASTDW